MADKPLVAEQRGSVLLLTLNRPQKLNALNTQVLEILEDEIRRAAADGSVRVLVLTGAGDRAFVAGADLEEIAGKSPVEMWQYLKRGQGVLSALEGLGKPSIAAVNGLAAGGGCELALACTLRVAAEQARFVLPELGLGGLPGFGGTQRLARLIGAGRALEYLLTGDPIEAQEAGRIGLANRVVPQADLIKTALEMAEKIATKAPVSVEMALAAVRGSLELPLGWGLALERSMASLCASTEDSREGLAALKEKRAPSFAGR